MTKFITNNILVEINKMGGYAFQNIYFRFPSTKDQYIIYTAYVAVDHPVTYRRLNT